jgi:hypothetical protein
MEQYSISSYVTRLHKESYLVLGTHKISRFVYNLLFAPCRPDSFKPHKTHIYLFTSSMHFGNAVPLIYNNKSVL